MDYAHRARLKAYVRMEALSLDADSALTELVTVPGYKAKLERIFRLRLESFDWNCPQHITPRFTMAEIEPAVSALRARIGRLEAENQVLRANIAAHAG